MLKGMLKEVIDSGVKLTPMMAQYFEIKKDYSETIVFFRMGDFYEVFFDDAILCAKLLNITQTHRGKLGDIKIPMAGIPHHAATSYIDRITGQGYKVAVCEQVQNPKDAVGIVKRAVTQVVSPGIPYDLSRASEIESYYLASAYQGEKAFYLCLLDYTTGHFFGLSLDSEEELVDKISLYSPREFLAYLGQWEKHPLLSDLISKETFLTTFLSEDYFSAKLNELYIERLIPSFKRDEILKSHNEILNSIAPLGYYVCSTQGQSEFGHIRPFRMENTSQCMKVSLPTLAGLEILPRQRGMGENYKNSLLGFMDKTRCALGARQLKNIFLNPLFDIEQIQNRQKAISFFLENEELHHNIREKLFDVRDLERILAKASTKKATSADLINFANSIIIYSDLARNLSKLPKSSFDKISKKNLEVLLEISQRILKTINDEVGASIDKGNLILPKANKRRDKLAKLSQNAANEVLALEENYRIETGIQKLRVKHNNINGYFIEVTKSHANKLPKKFVRKQTLVNTERFLTDELADFEKEVLSAKEKLERLEREIFESFVEELVENSNLILIVGKALGKIDVLQSFAWVAYKERFSCPIIDPKLQQLEISDAWHPLIKANIQEQFVSHDLSLNASCPFGLITGPNMAGKTTVMREMAIIQFLAQLGSYVPAKSAKLGLCNYLFSRLGASDDILKGQSTFMVEMSETAEILRHANERSLIIMDEVGRGTSTFDGMSIAWALVEHFIKETKALTLFSTHYHELIDLVNDLQGGKNLTVETKQVNGKVNFLYRLIEGGASQSYGIHVAKMAGLPRSILKRSNEVLNSLEANSSSPEGLKDGDQLSFFNSNFIETEKESDIENEINELDLANMTPLQALQKLDEFQGHLRH